MPMEQLTNSETSLSKAINEVDRLIDMLQNGSLSALSGRAVGPESQQHSCTSGMDAGLDAGKTAKKKKKKQKGEPSQSLKKPNKTGDEVQDIIQKAFLVVAQVDHVAAHPESDKLLVTKLNCGDHERQIVAGLQQYVDLESFQGSKVVCIINLKTAKLGGETSEGMILASTSDDGRVQPICPPSSSAPGSMVFPENSGDPDRSLCPKTLKGDIWRKIVPELEVISGTCCYKGKTLCTSQGPVTAPGVDKGTIS